MINTLRLYEELSDTFGEAPARALTRAIGSIYDDLKNTVTKEDFRELKQVVAELAQAQKRTEERVEELAQAQKRTEERVEELAQAQKRTEERVEELAQAQKRTEEAVYHLSRRLDDTNRQLGGLAMTVGYTLENSAYVYLPALLKADYGVSCEEPLYRDYLTDNKGADVEVNILGRAKKDAQDLLIVGESKAQLSKKDVQAFIKRVTRIDTGGLRPFPVLVTHMISQRDVKNYAQSQGVAIYLSYQFQNPVH